MEGQPPASKTVEEVYADFNGRRAGLVRALTTDVEKFFQKCSPEKENLCLYAFPDERWEVDLPVEEVPPEIPEPALGINFARDGMERKEWLSLVAIHSDSWLLAVAFYFGARFGFTKHDRKKLYNMISELPSVFDAVMETMKTKKDLAANHSNGSSRKANGKMAMASGGAPKIDRPPPTEEYETEEEDSEDEEEFQHDDDDEDQGATCGACGKNNDGPDQFWIYCDNCSKWFHGKCVKITPAKAAHIKIYKCPACSNKKPKI